MICPVDSAVDSVIPIEITGPAAKRLEISMHQIETLLEVSKLQNGGFCAGFE